MCVYRKNNIARDRTNARKRRKKFHIFFISREILPGDFMRRSWKNVICACTRASRAQKFKIRIPRLKGRGSAPSLDVRAAGARSFQRNLMPLWTLTFVSIIIRNNGYPQVGSLFLERLFTG